MPAVNDFDRRPRALYLPYIYGAITGISLGLVAILILFQSRGNESPVKHLFGATQPTQTQLANYDPGNDITSSRVNAIVLATQRVTPAVVTIQSTSTVRRRIYNLFWNRYFPYERERSNSGSGFIVSSDGHIFTNYHVVASAHTIWVTLADGSREPAELVGRAPSHDLAVLKIDRENLPTAALGDSEDLLVGEWAIAIGSPFGNLLVDKQPTVTVGVISALHRDIKQDPQDEQVFNDMVQTDAAINPGNSGGPLVNGRGEVIGINTAIIGATGADVGMGFAIPINRARYVIDEITQYGRVRDVWVGMTATDVTPALQAGLDLASTSGVLIQGVEEGGPAEKAGLSPGDLLLEIDGVEVHNTDHANRLIFGARVGDSVEMRVIRKDELKNFTLKLEERPTG